MTTGNLLRFIKCMSQIHKLSVYLSRLWTPLPHEPFWHSSFPTPPLQPHLLSPCLFSCTLAFLAVSLHIPTWHFGNGRSRWLLSHSPLVVWACGAGGARLQFTKKSLFISLALYGTGAVMLRTVKFLLYLQSSSFNLRKQKHVLYCSCFYNRSRILV